MNKFGKRSTQKLNTTHIFLQALAHKVLEDRDITILHGHRGEEEQNSIYQAGNSDVMFPKSDHNSEPSLALDFAPYPINWDDTGAFIRVRELFYQQAGQHNIVLKPLVILTKGRLDLGHIAVDLEATAQLQEAMRGKG